MIGWLVLGIATLVQPQAGFTTKTFVSSGHTLAYEVAGTGQPVVILSGGPGLAPDYVRPVAETVSKKARAILLHQWGTGKSPISKRIVISEKTININTAVADLESLRIHLGVPKITLLGHSWGGMLAQAYAGKHPQRTGRLILVSSGGPDSAFMTYFIDNLNMRQTGADIAEYQEALKIEDPEKQLEAAMLARIPAYFYSREDALREKEATRGKFQLNSDIMEPLIKYYDVKKTIGKYKGQVTIIQGRQDPIDPSTAYQVKSLLPQAKLVWVERCGHFPWIERPTEFAKAIEAALR